VIQARYRADDGWLDARRLTMGYAAASGAAMCVQSPALGFRRRGERVIGVETPGGTVACEQVVIAAGPFSGQLASLAGLPVDLRPTIRYKLVLPDVPEVPPDAPMTIDDDTGTHWRPFLRGAAVLCTDPSTEPSPPTAEVPLDHGFPFEVLDPAGPLAAARIAPFWRDVWERGAPAWFLQAGQYTMTPDHRPLVGETAVRGLWVNTGYSGHGVMASPAASRILADLLTGRLATDANPFRQDREFRRRDLDTL
jgi:sarcosine oxidase subunit beta